MKLDINTKNWKGTVILYIASYSIGFMTIVSGNFDLQNCFVLFFPCFNCLGFQLNAITKVCYSLFESN